LARTIERYLGVGDTGIVAIVAAEGRLQKFLGFLFRVQFQICQ